MFNGNVPYSYEESNIAYGMSNPSAVTVQNTRLTGFFRRYLLQKVMSVAKWELPANWKKNYFLYALHVIGNVAVIKTDRYGVIPQHCTLSGFDVQSQPLKAVVSNPLIAKNLDLTIGKNCTLFNMTCDYGGVLDLVNYYAGMLALASEAISTNTLNAKLAYVFAAQDSRMGETMKKAADELLSGKPFVVADKKLFSADGKLSMDLLLNNLKQNYIAPDMVNVLHSIENEFDAAIGLPPTHSDKRERMITDEVSNADTTRKSRYLLWLEGWQEAAERTNEMFGTNISVNLRG